MQNVALLIKAACTFTPQRTNFPLAENLTQYFVHTEPFDLFAFKFTRTDEQS